MDMLMKFMVAVVGMVIVMVEAKVMLGRIARVRREQLFCCGCREGRCLESDMQ